MNRPVLAAFAVHALLPLVGNVLDFVLEPLLLGLGVQLGVPGTDSGYLAFGLFHANVGQLFIHQLAMCLVFVVMVRSHAAGTSARSIASMCLLVTLGEGISFGISAVQVSMGLAAATTGASPLTLAAALAAFLVAPWELWVSAAVWSLAMLPRGNWPQLPVPNSVGVGLVVLHLVLPVLGGAFDLVWQGVGGCMTVCGFAACWLVSIGVNLPQFLSHCVLSGGLYAVVVVWLAGHISFRGLAGAAGTLALFQAAIVAFIPLGIAGALSGFPNDVPSAVLTLIGNSVVAILSGWEFLLIAGLWFAALIQATRGERNVPLV